MKQKEFLKQIIDLSFAYIEAHASNPDVVGFSEFLSESVVSEMNGNANASQKLTSEADDLGIRLVLLNRYAKEYVKMALEDSPLKTADEFSFLISLFALGSHTKSELINKMLLTKTSGTEVIKRLLNKGFIIEYDDATDKRSKRIEINEQGREVVLKLLPRISISSDLIKGNLSSSELQRVIFLLSKLENHHKDVFQNSSREELMKYWDLK
ncbi:MAG: MarR family winged helix-turn-helix transcriptional regulator [Bacteroidota bacterium]